MGYVTRFSECYHQPLTRIYLSTGKICGMRGKYGFTNRWGIMIHLNPNPYLPVVFCKFV